MNLLILIRDYVLGLISLYQTNRLSGDTDISRGGIGRIYISRCWKYSSIIKVWKIMKLYWHMLIYEVYYI